MRKKTAKRALAVLTGKKRRRPKRRYLVSRFVLKRNVNAVRLQRRLRRRLRLRLVGLVSRRRGRRVRLVSAAEACSVFGMCRQSLGLWRKRGLRCYGVPGKTVFYDPQDIKRFLVPRRSAN